MTDPTTTPQPANKQHNTLLIGASVVVLALAIGFAFSRLGATDNLITDGASAATQTTVKVEVVLTNVTAAPRSTTTTTTPPPPTTVAAPTILETEVNFTGEYDVCPAGSEPVQSSGVIKDGVITLTGDVPTFDDAQRITAVAAEILGTENVDNQYRLCPTAGDPNDGRITVQDAVLFESASAVIADEFTPLLNQGVALMALRPSVEITVLGHTDNIGSNLYNAELSLLRAEAVIEYLVNTGGVDPARLAAVGVGEFDPVESNETDDGRQQNRRIEFLLTNLLADE